MKLLILTVVVFAAAAAAQNPYEYVDDALLDKVAKIVYDYDQKVAASRSAGGAGTSSQVYQPQQVQRNGVYGQGQDYYRQGRVSNNFNNANANYRRENNYGVQQQQVRSQRQYTYQPRVQQQQQTYVQPRVQREQTFIQPRVQQQPYVAVAPRTYQEPQVVQQQQQTKSQFTYSYSQPEVAQRVAEFHFTENKNQGSFDSARVTNVESNKYRLV